MKPDFRVWRYSLPLVAPASLAPGMTVDVREGFLLEVVEDGRSRWGEAAPLPGFSHESMDDARRSLEEVVGSSVPEVVSPSAGFALASVLEPSATDGFVAVCGLLSGSRDEILADAEELRRAGYEAVKLKVGRAETPDDAALVREVRNILGEGVSLRLDANRAWSFGGAVEFARRIGGVEVEFVEEPLEDVSRLRELSRRTSLPVALDESLSGAGFDAASHEYAMAFVLKPTVVGAFRTLSLADSARDIGAKVVISSAYESGIGTLALLRLASSIGDAPAGLDTYRRLADDVLSPRLDLSMPRVDVGELLGMERRVEYEKMERVA